MNDEFKNADVCSFVSDDISDDRASILETMKMACEQILSASGRRPHYRKEIRLGDRVVGLVEHNEFGMPVALWALPELMSRLRSDFPVQQGHVFGDMCSLRVIETDELPAGGVV